ncbi:L-cystine permease [Liquorilactobacillus sucicola DSM 21376 = JCM 15457]|uniref:L-cystine permease n=1 Tax=Liquorilactobacillus sucicola DSM 21376 = JCM 15457 TaxID=1423806 RepID=A0A0R2DVW7_9LACO|nr:amino acid ABC transporter permease [Liquorilactobacillus sucicola]KRN07507.1 L-cystine permease [Liquorilactobacillus sucicola DSM 21376 = JCM 15457]
MFFDIKYLYELFPQIISSLPITLSIVVVSTIGGLILGLIIAYFRIERIPLLNWLGALYVSFVQGTPIIVQLFVVYYGAPAVLDLAGINVADVSKISFMFIAYGLNSAAYFSEIIRAAINDIPKTQFDAAYSVGMNKYQAYRKIIIPQATKAMAPNVEVSVVSLLQNSSLATYLGIMDIMGKSQLVGTNTGHQMEAYIDAMVIFMVLSLAVHYLFRYFGLTKRHIKFRLYNVRPLAETNELSFKKVK